MSFQIQRSPLPKDGKVVFYCGDTGELERIHETARRHGCTISDLCRQCIRFALDNMEDQ